MENKVNLFDIIVTAILVIAACFGIGFTVHNRVDKGTGEVTLENYGKYLNVRCSVSNGWGGSPYSMQYDYSVVFRPAQNYILKDLVVEYTLESEYSDLPQGTYKKTFGFLELSGSESGTVHYEYPKELSTLEVMGIHSEIEINIISVSGTFEYRRAA